MGSSLGRENHKRDEPRREERHQNPAALKRLWRFWPSMAQPNMPTTRRSGSRLTAFSENSRRRVFIHQP